MTNNNNKAVYIMRNKIQAGLVVAIMLLGIVWLTPNVAQATTEDTCYEQVPFQEWKFKSDPT
jgi:hypothetical protein